MSAEEEDGYDGRNRAFLQAFIARSTLTFEEAKPILASILSAYGEFSYINGVFGNDKSPYTRHISNTIRGLHQDIIAI